MPAYEDLKKVLDDVVGFIKSFVDQLKEFIGYWKKEINWVGPTDDVTVDAE